MNRFKLKKEQFPIVKKFLKGTNVKKVPSWAKKFKDQLSIKNNKIYFTDDGRDKEVVAMEDVDSYLRKRILSKDIKDIVPNSRDGCFYKLFQETCGIPRRVIMKWLRAQKAFAETRPSLPEPKIRSQRKLKKYQLQSDLIFVRRDDIIKANKKFANDELKKETYIITTLEQATGLVRLDYLQTKDQTTSVLEKHIKWFEKALKTPAKDMQLRTDKGSEYNMPRIKKLIPDYKFVPSAGACEQKNKQAQQQVFRLLKCRQARTVKTAVRMAQHLCNETMSSIHRKTPKEIIEQDKDVTIKKFNSTRKKYQAGDNRKELQVGDFVRRLAPKKKRTGLNYKSYKGLAFIDEIARKITHKTKKAQPPKYRVGRKWYLQSDLLLAAKDDDISKELIKSRDKEDEDKDAEMRKFQLEFQKSVDVVKDAEFKAGKKSTRKSSRLMKKLHAQRAKDEAQGKLIEDAELAYQKKQAQIESQSMKLKIPNWKQKKRKDTEPKSMKLKIPNWKQKKRKDEPKSMKLKIPNWKRRTKKI